MPMLRPSNQLPQLHQQSWIWVLSNKQLVQLPQFLVRSPPNMTTEAFSTKYPESTCTITLNLGQPVTCHYVDQKVFITSSAKFLLPGYASSSPKPIFLYAGGTWISDSSKVGRPIFWLSTKHSLKTNLYEKNMKRNLSPDCFKHKQFLYQNFSQKMTPRKLWRDILQTKKIHLYQKVSLETSAYQAKYEETCPRKKYLQKCLYQKYEETSPPKRLKQS